MSNIEKMCLLPHYHSSPEKSSKILQVPFNYALLLEQILRRSITEKLKNKFLLNQYCYWKKKHHFVMFPIRIIKYLRNSENSFRFPSIKALDLFISKMFWYFPPFSFPSSVSPFLVVFKKKFLGSKKVQFWSFFINKQVNHNEFN